MNLILRILNSFIIGFNWSLDVKDNEYFKKKLIDLYKINNLDITKLSNFTKPVDNMSLYYLYKHYIKHISYYPVYFILSLLGLLCVVLLLYGIDIGCLNSTWLRNVGILFIINKTIHILSKIFASFSRIKLLFKKDNYYHI